LLVEKAMFRRKKKVRPRGKKCTKKPEESLSTESSSESDLSSSSGSEMDDVDDGKEWAKKVDDDLCQHIVMKKCRNLVNDTYFDNPPCTMGKLQNFYNQISKLTLVQISAGQL
jgi:hypothetical protein